MEKPKSIKINFIMNIILTMSSMIFPLLTFPYVSRILLPAGMGKVSFASSLIAYFNMFAQLGIPMYGIRACARVRDNRRKLTKVAQELLIINLIMSFVSYLLLAGAIIFVPRLQEERSLIIIVSATIILTAIGMEWIYKALEQYTYIAIRSIVFKIIALVGMFFLINKEEDYILYGGISIFAACAANILNFINVRKYIDLKPVGNYQFKKHLSAVAIFFAMACATTIYTNLNTIMLGFMKTDEDVGYYNAAMRINGILVSIVTSLGAVILPRSSYYIENGQVDAFKQISKKALNFVFLIATPLWLYFTFFAKQGVYFLSGRAFESSIFPMQIIMPTLLLIGITNILGIQILVPQGKEGIVLKSVVVGAIVNVIASIILIPRIAATGAAIGTLIAETVVLIVQCVFLRKEIKNLFRDIKYLKLIIALLLGSVSSFWVKQLQLNDFATLIISAGLFFGAYALALIIVKEPLSVDIANQIKNALIKGIKKTK